MGLIDFGIGMAKKAVGNSSVGQTVALVGNALPSFDKTRDYRLSVIARAIGIKNNDFRLLRGRYATTTNGGFQLSKPGTGVSGDVIGRIRKITDSEFEPFFIEKADLTVVVWTPKTSKMAQQESLLDAYEGFVLETAPVAPSKSMNLPIDARMVEDRAALAKFFSSHFPSREIAVYGFDAISSGEVDVRFGPAAHRPQFFDGERWTLKRGADALKIDQLAQKSGRRLLRRSGEQAFVGRLTLYDEGIRDRFAALLKCQPWDVDVYADWVFDGQLGKGRISHVFVNRLPKEAADREKREKTLRDLSAALGGSWQIDDDIATGQARLTAFVDRIASDKFSIGDFLARYPNPASVEESWKKFAVALSEDGEPIWFTLFHTLIIGQTGSGKGSVLWSVVAPLLPAMQAGLVEIYAIDPKNSETKISPNLFKEIAVDADDWAPLLERLVVDLKARQANSGRSFQISTATPLRIIFIDELSALSVLDPDPKRAKSTMANLNVILSQGRSDGNIVIAAAQAPQKEMIGQSRMFFGMRIALRTESASETDIVLGTNATAEGATAHLIEPANPGNDYKTAGIGFMRVEGYAKPVRVRFPFTSDDQLEEWDRQFSGTPTYVKPQANGRIVLPMPNQAVYNIWDSRFQSSPQPASLPSGPTVATAAAPVPATPAPHIFTKPSGTPPTTKGTAP
ncbi:FtsK/SpoIIIE domain-containing protein [Lacisediminihabitans sp. FW035]